MKATVRGLAIVLCSSCTLGLASRCAHSQENTPDAAQESRPSSAPASQISDLPKDPALRHACEELVAAMRALTTPTDQDISTFEERVLALMERLVALGENAA